ncbi:PH and SEC7 domain-containing protein 1 isoform X2 [Oryzias melastigma]|uniref:PH and SEC7 domain-containing protein 1 isoform X2 n=1 Tax=Oryzias melastigma TaxID=30732 RepID=UPI000CF7B495|nr:PH and SEC7 domain-containing protein 1 isoform X2 [Oryzias melastigma]
MSQAGKVLHLYVEVRSVSEEEQRGLGRGEDGSAHLMLPCPDTLAPSQRSSARCSPTRSPALSPVSQRHMGVGNHNLLPSKSSLRHSVDYSVGPATSPTQRQDVLYESVGQLLEILAPKTSGSCSHGSHGRTSSSEVDPFSGRVPISPSSTHSSRLSMTPSPNDICSSYEVLDGVDGAGKTSVVSFGYIDKASVRSNAELRNSVCLNVSDCMQSRREGQQVPARIMKRMSDPVWLHDHPLEGGTFHRHHRTPRESPWGSPNVQRGTVEAVARDATNKALDEFGSPELKRRFAKNYSPTLPHHHSSPRCRSLGGSPVLSRSTLTLPCKTQLQELDRKICHSSMNGLPRSPASDHLCAQTGFILHSDAPNSTFHSHRPAHSQQRPWMGDESPRLSSKFHPPLPAGRPTDIQHEVPASMFSYQPGSPHLNANASHYATDGSWCRTNDVVDATVHKPSRCSSRASDADSWISDRTSASPSSNPEHDCKLAVGASKYSRAYAGKQTPSPTPSPAESLRSESPRSSSRESRLYGSPHRYDSVEHLQVDHQHCNTEKLQTKPGSISPLVSHRGHSTPASPAIAARCNHAPVSQVSAQQKQTSPTKEMSLHRCQPPQSTGALRSPHTDRWQYNHLFDASQIRTQLTCQNPEGLPGSWTSRGARAVQDGGDTCGENISRKSSRPSGPEESHKRDRALLELDTHRSQNQSGLTRMSSQSSSGATGSLSPETWSQSSHAAAHSGSGMQTGGDTASIPPSRSQKIARAKWEFLFGGKSEDSRCRKEAPPTTPPTSSPPSPPSSLSQGPACPRRGWDGEGPKLSHHAVRQVEVELVTPHPRGAALKTGIIRRAIKYSETDLDAVPLRCYRETDLDEVMRAESEAPEEADSAFGSNRSVLESSSFTPSNASPKAHTGEREENGEEEEGEEEEEEEGVASWASVRMLGDRRRQRAAKEEEEVFSLLLRGSLEPSSDTHGGLKSPISVGSPRRPSESNMDSFSRHFESIMESHRAKGTSYSSLDSVDLLTSGSTSVFTFDLPTLTPEIQSQICESAKQISELSFAPLAHSDGSTPSEMSRSEISLNVAETDLRAGSKVNAGLPVRSKSEKETWRRSILKDGFRKASSVPALHSGPRERAVNRPLELLYPQDDVAERLALGGSDDALANGLKPDLQAANRLARRLYNLDGFRKSDVARHLGKNNEFSQMVAEEYLSCFNFKGLTIDQALRLFLSHFALMGETQERERVLAHFSRRYKLCNPDSLSTEDSIHTLTCAVMLLNTDLHGNNVGKRMSCTQFISNLEGLNDGKDFPKELLKILYSSIKNEKLQWTIDEEELRKSISELAESRTDSASHTMKRLGSGGNPLVGVAQQADGELYMSGFLVRKVHADPDGKRTPRGKRGWKSFYAMLKGLVLYLQKDEYRTERELTEEDVKNAVSVHHSLAMRAVDYSKRPNVFYLRTADWRVFLFQAPNAEQMQSWITRINVVAAMFSAPPFPAAIGSQKRFSRPLLPGSGTKLSQEEQAKSHENRFRAVSSELLELTTATPDRKVKGRELEEQKLRREYLEFEKTRYGTYAMLLRAKLTSGAEGLQAFESQLLDEGGLQRAHSSPTLPQDVANKEKIRGTKTSKSLKVTPSSRSGGGSEGGRRKNGSQRAEIQKQSSKQEEAA